MLEFKNVTKKYTGGKYALDKVSFTVEQGEFLYLIGPSGAGKTTILRILIGESKATSGKIIYEKHEINNFKRKKIAYLRRDIRMVFQDFKVLHDRTIIENVMLSLFIVGKKTSEAESEAKKALKLVGLEGKEKYFPVQISAGELQRVAIARAIAGGSRVLLADEPTGNLDPKNSQDIIKLLEELNSEGTTVIIATHNAQLVNKTKKRVIELKEGKVTRDEKQGKYETSS